MLRTVLEWVWQHPALVISNLAFLVSVLSLGFTVGSFYWMNWRQGKLRVSGPLLAFGARGSQDELLVMIAPLVFFNDGARPIIVEDLRLFFLSEQDKDPLRFSAIFADLKPKLGDVERTLPAHFPVRGREALRMICEFQRNPGRLLFATHNYPMELYGKLDQNPEWVSLCKFDINVSEDCLPHINQILRTYHLDPDVRGLRI